jgi:hypothetical protein
MVIPRRAEQPASVELSAIGFAAMANGRCRVRQSVTVGRDFFLADPPALRLSLERRLS